MEIGFRGAPQVEAAVGAGLEGLGFELATTTTPLIVAGTPDDFPSFNAERTFIAIEVGGIGGYAIDGVEASIAVIGPEGPCRRCLKRRVEASTSTPIEPSTPSSESARYAGAVAGRLIHQTGVEALDQRLGVVRLLDGGERRVLPVPGCSCEREFDRFEAGTEDPPAGEALDRAELAVDPILGIIAQVGEQSSYPAPYYIAEVADTTSFSDARAARYAAGVDLDWDDAFMRAIGEGLERYCAGCYHLDALPEEPKGRTIELADIATADDDGSVLGRWWPAIDLNTEENVSLPAEAVTFPPPAEADITGITTGLGLGATWTDAVLAGLVEVIERDACMLGWYSTYEPLELEVNHEPYQILTQRLAGEGLASTALVMTQDIDIPVVTAVVHRRDGEGDALLDIPGVDPDAWPSFAVGSAASLDPAVAAERALAEAGQNWIELLGMGPERAAQEGAIGEFATYPRQARTLLKSWPKVDAATIAPSGIEDAQSAIDHCLTETARAGLSMYAARTTTRDVASLGFEAVRVVSPEAQPLVRDRTHFADRLSSVPRELGFRPRLDRGDHPYP